MQHILQNPLSDTKKSISAFSVIRVPFFLEPDYDEDLPHIESNRDRLIKKWGGKQGWELQKKRHDLKGRGLEAGIPHFNLDRLASNSMASHRLIQHIGKEYGLSASEAVYDRLNVYYFVEGHALNDRPRLAQVVHEELSRFFSLSPGQQEQQSSSPSVEEILDFLQDNSRGRQEIKDARMALEELGVHGIPKFIVDHSIIDGAARPETFIQKFREIEYRGKINGPGPIFASILGIPPETIEAGSHRTECQREEK